MDPETSRLDAGFTFRWTELDDAVGHAHAAIDELRELAAGLHPPVLAHRGLVVAVEELAARAVLPVAVTGCLPHRLPEAV